MKRIYLTLMFITIAGLFIFVPGCQCTAKNWGGTMTYDLKPGKRLVNMTWKEDDLWILQRDTKTENDLPQTYEFIESSNWGVFQGTIIVKEQK